MNKVSFLKNSCFKLLMMLAIIIGFLIIGNKVQAGSITLNKLDFDIKLNEDGSMDVTETWDAKIRDTNTMFKDIHMDSTKFKDITSVEVYRVNNDGTKTKLTKINEEMYHVTKDCYYGLVTNNGDFEIAWGVLVNNTENRKYQIKYKVIDAVKTYQDCSELYWQLVGNENTIPVTKLTATIFLPKPVTNTNNLRAWAHGPYNGNVYPQTNKVTLEVDYLNPETMVEARIAVLENLFSKNTVVTKNRLNTILEQEQQWANKANEERKEYIANKARQEKIRQIISIITIIANIALSALLIFFFIKNLIKSTKIKKIQKPIIDYFRDIPDEKASAGDAAFLYYYKNGSFSKNISNILSATILQLAMKKYIVFSEDKTGKRPDVRISILDYSNNIEQMPPLKKDEQIVYNLLIKVADSTKNNIRTFTMKEMEKYAKSHSSTFTNKINSIEDYVKSEQVKLGNYNKAVDKKIATQTNYITVEIIFGIFGLFVLPIPAILLLCNIIPHIIMYSKLNSLTKKGIEEAEKWKALKKYMEDFSLLNEKEVPDLILWEKYLVFATAFGIADKVLKQLKVKYPELQEREGYNYIYMGLLYRSTLNTAFLSSLNNSVHKAYMGGLSAQASSNYGGGNFSSGSGFGGGFSGGGGFGGGGGRNGRKIKNEKREFIFELSFRK